MPTYAAVDESRARLHAAGWSVGEVGTGGGWFVSGTKGENALKAAGRTQAEAWWRACQQAAAVGMLGRLSEADDSAGARREHGIAHRFEGGWS